MKTWEKIAAIGGVGIAGIGAFLAFKFAGGLEYSPGGDGAGNCLLQTIVGPVEGGTVTPNSASGVNYPLGTKVDITATPNSGYTIGGWMVDGHDIGSQASKYTITMDRPHSVIVTFWLGGVPPAENTPPVAIQAIDASKKVYGYYGCVLSLVDVVGFLGWKGLANTTINYCDSNWNMGAVAEYQMSFKVIDAAGRPVPNSEVDIWTDAGPDAGKYVGYLILNKLGPGAHAQGPGPNGMPVTDVNGIVTVNLSYFDGANDGYKTLCRDAGLKYTLCNITCSDYSPVDKALGISGTVYKSNSAVGDCYTMQPVTQSAQMGPFIPNYVHAQIFGTAIPATAAVAYCGFHVKMLSPINVTPPTSQCPRGYYWDEATQTCITPW